MTKQTTIVVTGALRVKKKYLLPIAPSRLLIIWAASSKKNVSSNIIQMILLCTKSHPGLCTPFIRSVVANVSISRQ